MIIFNCFILILIKNIDLEYINLIKIINDLEPEKTLEIMNKLEKK